MLHSTFKIGHIITVMAILSSMKVLNIIYGCFCSPNESLLRSKHCWINPSKIIDVAWRYIFHCNYFIACIRPNNSVMPILACLVTEPTSPLCGSVYITSESPWLSSSLKDVLIKVSHKLGLILHPYSSSPPHFPIRANKWQLFWVGMLSNISKWGKSRGLKAAQQLGEKS